jgi:hypothetical protein
MAVGDGFGFEGIGRLVERSCDRARLHSRAWIAFWLCAILVVTVVVAVYRAPTGAYGVLLVVAIVMLSANGRSEGP